MSTPPRRADYGSGAYRRRILLIAEGHRVSGELEDDFHHFRARLEHDGERVTRAEGDALRVPWTTCPGAVDVLARLVGLPLSRSLRAAAAHTEPREQCTHLFDAAALAVGFASLGTDGRRVWEAVVPDRQGGLTTATLTRDGEPLLRWEMDRQRITGPAPFEDRPLIGGFGRWAEAQLTADLAEAAQILQRAVFIANGRRHDLDSLDRAEQRRHVMGDACHTYSPTHVLHAVRVKGSVRDLTDGF